MSNPEKRAVLTPNLFDILKKAQLLAQTNPERFAFFNGSNDNYSWLVARTELGAGSGVELVIDITKGPDYVTQSMGIVSNNKLIYRLDEKSGQSIDEDRQKIIDFLDDDLLKNSPLEKRTMEMYLDRFYKISDTGQVLEINDGYAETIISADVVDDLLSKKTASLPVLRENEIKLSEVVKNRKVKLFD